MFWKLKIEPKKVYVMKIKNPVHITMVSIDPRNRTLLLIPIHIRHRGKLHLICTLSESKWDIPLNLKFDSTDDKVEFYLDCQLYWNPELKPVYLSGSEKTASKQNVITTRLLTDKDLYKFEENDYENNYITSDKASDRTDRSSSKNRKTKQIYQSSNISVKNRNDNESKRVVKNLCTNENDIEKYNKKTKANVEYDDNNDNNDDDDNGDGDDDDDVKGNVANDDDDKDDDDTNDEDDKNDKDNDNSDSDSDDDKKEEEDADNDVDHEDINVDRNDKKVTHKKNKKQHITKKRNFPIAKYMPVKGKKKLLENNIKVIRTKSGFGLPAKNGEIAHVCITSRWQIGDKEKIFSMSSKKPPFFKLKVGQITGIKIATSKLKIGEIRRIIAPFEITAFGHSEAPPVDFKNCNFIYDIEVKDITNWFKD